MDTFLRFRHITILTIIALLISVIVPFFAVYNLQGGGDNAEQESELSALFGDKILICTADGFKWVSIADLETNQEQPEPHHDYKCGICYLAANGLQDIITSDAAIEIAYAITPSNLSYGFVYVFVDNNTFKNSFQTRAPPFIA